MYRGCFNVVAMVEFEGHTTASAMQRALEHVQRHHQCLRVEVAEHPREPQQWLFRESASLPRVEVVERHTPEQWHQEWYRLARSPIEGLAWRAVWLRREGEPLHQVVVAFHHSVSDMQSLVVFFDGLLTALHDLRTGKFRETQHVPIHAPLHHLAKGWWPIAGLARVGFHQLMRRIRTAPFDSEAPLPRTERQWRGSFQTVDSDTLGALAARCRREQITVGSALSAAMILELAERVREREGPGAFDVGLGTTFDLRRYQQQSIDARQMGMLATMVPTFYRPSPRDDVWTLGRKVRATLNKAVERNEHRDFAHLPRLVVPAAAALLARYNHGRPEAAALLISNFGRLDGLEHGAFRARRMFATAAQAAWGNTFVLGVMTVRGTMCVHLGHPWPLISDATGQEFLDRLLQRVTGACG